jgi:hypothetical protein
MWLDNWWCKRLRTAPDWPNIRKRLVLGRALGLLSIFITQVLLAVLSLQAGIAAYHSWP